MIIFRYLTKEVYGTLLASTVVLLLLLISNQFVHYLTQAAAGIMPLRTVMRIVSLQMPLLLPLLLPLGLYIGILVAYGRLYADREMIVLWSCGFSKAQLVGITLAFSSIVCVFIALLTLWVQPEIETYKRQILLDAAMSSPLERISPDQFVPLPGDKLVFYAQKLSRDHQHLQDVFVAQRSDKSTSLGGSAWDIVIANEGHQQVDKETRDRFLVLSNGYRYMGIPGESDFQTIQYKTYGVRIQRNAIPADNRVETLSTRELLRQRHGHHAIQAELQWRVAQPLSAFILALLAIPLSRVDPRQGRYAQLAPAFLLYILYVNLLFVSRAWLQKGQIASGIGIWWVHLLMFLIAGILLWRFVGWRRGIGLLNVRSKEKL